MAARDGGTDTDLHVSLTAPDEKHAVEASKEPVPATARLVCIGVGCAQAATFVVVLSADGDCLRARLGLPPKDFHATLGFHKKDAHGADVSKDASTLVDDDLVVGPVEAEVIVRVGVTGSPATSKLVRNLDALAPRAVRARPVRGTVRIFCALAQLQFERGQTETAMALLGRREDADGGDRLLEAAKGSRVLDPEALWVLWDTRLALRTKLGLCVPDFVLQQVVPSVVGKSCEGALWSGPVTPMVRVLRRVNAMLIRQSPDARAEVLGVSPAGVVTRYPLPRNFSRVDDAVCASAIVTTEYLPALAALGITAVINLMAEDPPKPEFVAEATRHGITVHHVPVVDREAPTLSQLEEALALLAGCAGGAVHADAQPCRVRHRALVHCLGGVGRTGCILAAHMMKTQGAGTLGPDAAVRALQADRKTILTPPQRALLSTWFGVLAATCGNPLEGAPRMQAATRDTAPDIILLCGLPGAGKSTWTQLLLQVMHLSAGGACRPLVTTVQQDEDGKATYAHFLTQWHKQWSRGVTGASPSAPSSRHHAVLDRCNLKAVDRAEAIAFAVAHHLTIACVTLDTPAQECIARIAGRSEHPVIKSGASGRRIVEDMAPLLEAPSQKEGFADVLHVRSDHDTCSVLDKWFGCGSAVGPIPGLRAGGAPGTSSKPGVSGVHIVSDQAMSGAHTAPTVHPDPVVSHGPPRKFPRTRHLANLGAATRDDLLLDPKEAALFLKGPVTVQEKVDGANVGFSVVDGQLAVQNRSHYVTSESGELFRPLGQWLQAHAADLWTVFEALPHAIVYGEWLHLKHSIHYTRLPDRLLVFDIFDGARGVFLDSARIDALLEGTTLVRTPTLFQGTISLADLCTMASSTPSLFYDGAVEGVYVRTERDGVVTGRAKIVRSDFLQTGGAGTGAGAGAGAGGRDVAGDDHVTHWSKGASVRNTLSF